MTVLDSHIWVWWVNEGPDLSSGKRNILAARQADGLGVSVISCWEIAKLVEKGRLAFAVPVGQWIDQALAYPGICLLPLDPRIAVASTQLPPPFHNDPADQIIVATAREMDCPLATDDGKILAYAHVKLRGRVDGKNLLLAGDYQFADDFAPGCSELADEPPHLVMATHEENLQSLRFDTEQEADFQPRPAFENIFPQPSDRDSGVQVRLAEAFGQDAQGLFRPRDIRVAQIFERGEKTRAEQDGRFSHVSASP